MAKVTAAELQKCLAGIDYPANKQDLIQHAQQQGADEDVCQTLEELPDREYEKPTDVSKAFGEVQ